MSKYPVIIGRFEYVDTTGELVRIPAKIDTGAKRSAIHASNIKMVKQGSKEVLHFTLLGHPAYPHTLKLSTSDFQVVDVLSSSGHKTRRYVVKLPIKLGYKNFKTSFTLSDRSLHVFPVLLGREALRKRYIVDVDRAGVVREELKKALDKSINSEEIEGVNA